MPKLHFNYKSLEALKPAQGKSQEDYWDTSTKGFGLRVFATGQKTWTVRYKIHKRLRRLSLGEFGPAGLCLADARARAQEVIKLAKEGIDSAEVRKQERSAETFGELSDIYLAWASKELKAWKDNERMLQKDILPALKSVRAKDVSKWQVNQIITEIADRDAKVHANRTFALIRRILNFGVEKGLLERNPVAGMKPAFAEKSRTRTLSHAELKLVWDALPRISPLFALAIRLQLFTSQRPGEYPTMEWSHIDLSERFWRMPGHLTKNGLPHEVPLSEAAISTLKEIRLSHKDPRWVFPSATSRSGHIHKLRPGIEELRHILNIHFTAHDIRRTVASHMTAMGVPRLVVSKILNHTDQGVTAIYDRYDYAPEKRKALEAWASRLAEIVSATPATWETVLSIAE